MKIDDYERYTIYRETETTGCEMEDGSDTSKTTSKLIIVPLSKDEEYGEHCASCYGDQDYSYRFNSKEVGVFFGSELKELKVMIDE